MSHQQLSQNDQHQAQQVLDQPEQTQAQAQPTFDQPEQTQAQPAPAPDQVAPPGKKKVNGQFVDICLGEEMIDYRQSDHRDKVLERDPLLVPGQELVLVSYIEGEAGTLLCHGCFQTDKQATAHLTELNKEREEAGLPIPKWSCTFKTGYWVSWPPKQEFFNKVRTLHPKTSGMAHTDQERAKPPKPADVLESVDNVMRNFFDAKARQKKDFVVNITSQAGKEFDDVENLMTKEEFEKLSRVRM